MMDCYTMQYKLPTDQKELSPGTLCNPRQQTLSPLLGRVRGSRAESLRQHLDYLTQCPLSCFTAMIAMPMIRGAMRECER